MPRNTTPADDDSRLQLTTRKLRDQLAARSRELNEAREQQVATAKILETINRAPTDLGPVFETIVTNAARLCEAHFAFVMLNEGDGLRLAARTGSTPIFAEYLEGGILADRTTTTGRAALERKPIQVLDFLADLEVVVTPAHRAENVRTVLAVPMLRGDTLLGVFSVWRREVQPFTDGQIRLLETFAGQAAIAIETVRLFDEIQDKSRQLEVANKAMSRFLAAASHDLRQPLHALNLFAGQLHVEVEPVARERLIARIDDAILSMNELFDAVLDVSQLDAGTLEPNLTVFPVERLLTRAETTFAEPADQKGLRFKIVPSDAWVQSDFVLLERILFNLVSNAVRYTKSGGVVIGCRRRGGRLQLEVWDTGAGIPENERRNIFTEFYQLSSLEPDRQAGLGLGLAIVERLSRLLDHPVELASRSGMGSRFSVSIPLSWERREAAEVRASPSIITDDIEGKLIVVIDDDAATLDSMHRTLRSWGCRVIVADSETKAIAGIRELRQQPDAIISDYWLAADRTGFQAIEAIHAALGRSVPAFIVSGEIDPDRLQEARAHGYHLLHKPASPFTLRTMLNSHLKGDVAVQPRR